MTSLSILLSIIASIVACSTPQKAVPSKAPVTFEVARSILTKFRSQQEVMDRLGRPSELVIDKSGQEVWNYNESETDHQRLTVTFSREKRTQSVLWIPRANEKEAKLDGILSQYQGLKLIPIETKEIAPPHDLSTETIYSDNKSISVLQNDSAKRVDAISWYLEKDKRLPSSAIEVRKRKLVNF